MTWPLVVWADDPLENAPSHARVRLEYVAPSELACPDRDVFASAIATRLGYEAIETPDGDASSTLSVGFRAEGKAVHVLLRLVNAGTEGAAEKTLVSETGACAELGAAAAFAAAILLDPRAMFPRPKAPPQAAPGASLESNSPGTWPWYEPRSPLPQPDRPAPKPPAPWKWHAGASAAACTGCAPALSVGALVVLGVSKGRWGLDGGVRADLPASATSPSGRRVASALALGEVFAHGRLGPMRVGMLGQAGTIGGESDGEKQASFFAAAGVRTALALTVAAPVFVRVAVDGLITLSRVSLRDTGSEVWSTPALAAGANLGAGVEF